MWLLGGKNFDLHFAVQFDDGKSQLTLLTLLVKRFALLRTEEQKGTFAQVLSKELSERGNRRLVCFEREIGMLISERITIDESSEIMITYLL